MEQTWNKAQHIAGKDSAFLNLRTGINSIQSMGRHPDRIDIEWEFTSNDKGQPEQNIEASMERFTNAILDNLEEKNQAVLSAIFTQDGVRVWVLYTEDVDYFSENFNDVFDEMEEEFPIEINWFIDQDWAQYNDFETALEEMNADN